jgi:hypothetical protein
MFLTDLSDLGIDLTYVAQLLILLCVLLGFLRLARPKRGRRWKTRK